MAFMYIKCDKGRIYNVSVQRTTFAHVLQCSPCITVCNDCRVTFLN